MEFTIGLSIAVIVGTLLLLMVAYRSRLKLIGELTETAHLDEVRSAIRELAGPARDNPLSAQELLGTPNGNGRVQTRRTSRDLLVAYGVYEEPPAWVHHVTITWSHGDIVPPAVEKILNSIRESLTESGDWAKVEMLAGESPGVYHVVGKTQ